MASSDAPLAASQQAVAAAHAAPAPSLSPRSVREPSISNGSPIHRVIDRRVQSCPKAVVDACNRVGVGDALEGLVVKRMR